jgi:transcriptional regulator with XRE-family HTH domain
MIEKKLALRDRIIGLLLREAREQAGKTKEECAEALEVSPGTITEYERGRQPISLPELEVLAYLLETPITYLLDQEADLEQKEKSLPLEKVLNLRHRIIGALLREARHEARLTQKDLAEVLECPSSRISDYEYGKKPIPVSELETLAEHLDLSLDYFLDSQKGPIGEWHQRQVMQRRFHKLPPEMQEFVTTPVNIKYLEVAMRLAKMPAGSLRDIAEGLLEITY